MSGQKKLIILLPFKHTHEGDTSPTQYHKDEVVFEDQRTAKYFCDAGWAKDDSGEFATGVPNGKEVRLEVQDGYHGSSAESLGQ